MLKPFGDRIVATEEKAAEKTASGIFLPAGDTREKSLVALVAEVGPDVKFVKKGDRVIFREYATTSVKLDGAKFLIAKEEDVLAKIEKGEK